MNLKSHLASENSEWNPHMLGIVLKQEEKVMGKDSIE